MLRQGRQRGGSDDGFDEIGCFFIDIRINIVGICNLFPLPLELQKLLVHFSNFLTAIIPTAQ